MNFNMENIAKMVNSDEFLELPNTSQLLFFHLVFNCDSNGVSNRPKAIARSIGEYRTEFELLSDLKLLQDAHFIRMDNGNCCIGLV